MAQRGRPSHKPTPDNRKTVESLAGLGMTQPQISSIVGIHPETLRSHYREELDNGVTKANSNVAQNLYTIAMGSGREAVTACIFWLKTRAGWSEHSPMPGMTKPEAVGKKEQAVLDAETADAGTGWAGLVH